MRVGAVVGALVVAPMAEKIHRLDLTVPESLLKPMREMGVFGLSIPAEYGGSSPAGHENTPMMIAVTETLSEASLAAAGSLITRPEVLARAPTTRLCCRSIVRTCTSSNSFGRRRWVRATCSQRP